MDFDKVLNFVATRVRLSGVWVLFISTATGRSDEAFVEFPWVLIKLISINQIKAQAKLKFSIS